MSITLLPSPLLTPRLSSQPEPVRAHSPSLRKIPQPPQGRKRSFIAWVRSHDKADYQCAKVCWGRDSEDVARMPCRQCLNNDSF